jgi:hypothetical protein
MLFIMPGYANAHNQLATSTARSASYNSGDLSNDYGLTAAMIVILDVTAIGSATLLLAIDAKDAASGKYYNLLTGASVTTNSTNRYRLGPLLASVANAVQQDYLPPVFRITVTQGGSGNATYSVGYSIGS